MHRLSSRTPPLATTLAFAVVLLAALAAPDAGHAQDVGLPIGSVPEAVVVEDLEGGSVDLAQWIGRGPVLVEFWAQWCEQCEALQPRLEAAARAYRGRAEILVIAVGVNQTPRSVRRHLGRHAMPGTVLFDRGGRAVRAFRAPATSYVVALDAAGRVVYTGSGADQDLAGALARATSSK